MATKITSRVIAPGAVTAEALAPGVGAGPVIANVQIANSSYVALDDTAVALDGGYILINGENFGENVQVIIANTNATSVTYISSSLVRAQVPAKSAGSYILYLVNTDTGATAIRVNAVTYSGTPTWSTGSSLADGAVDEVISIQLSATSDTSVTYQLQTGSTLPTGLTLAANGLLSGTVTGLNQDTLYNFTIEAIDAENQDSPRSFSITITVGDQYINSTVLALNADTNTFITDASTNNFAITPNGDTRPSAFSPYNTSWSNFFDGSGDFLSVVNNSAFQFGTGDFTVEFWLYAKSSSTTHGLVAASLTGSGYWASLIFSGLIYWQNQNGANNLFSVSYSGYYDKWTHVAFVRNSGTTKLYLNGIEQASDSDSTNYNGSSGNYDIGRDQDNTAILTGYISNLRIVKGTAVYTSNFTPPTSPLTAIANTSLLTCQSNRFKDNSTNNFTITRNGDVKVTSFGPFAETDTSTGSGYFDGTGDYLTTTITGPGTGDFTAEGWFYITAHRNYNTLMSQRVSNNSTTGWIVGADSTGAVYAYSGAFLIGPAGNVPTNSWFHIAFVRSSGNMTLYLNGVSLGTSSTSRTFSDTNTGVGGDGTDNFPLTGYASNIRYHLSTAIYTSNFTPPTSPLTAISGTSLLTLQNRIGYNNSQPVDESGVKNIITRNGNASVGSYTPHTPAGWSAYFDGSGDFLTFPSSASSQLNFFGHSEWCVEFWYYANAAPSGGSAAMVQSVQGGSNWRPDFGIAHTTANLLRLQISNTVVGTSSIETIPLNQWNHIAVVQTGGTQKVYLNGVATSISITNTMPDKALSFYVGKADNTAGAIYYINGYISNLRFLLGSTPYSSNFTPPSTPLEPIENTRALLHRGPSFTDDGPNRFAITRNGDTRITPFSPFKTHTIVPDSHSVYFDGTGDYLNTSYSTNLWFGSSNWTVECWVYPTSFADYGVIWDHGYGVPETTRSIVIYLNQTDGVIRIAQSTNGSNNFDVSTTATATLNTWQHLAFVRNGSTIITYKNGVSIGTITAYDLFNSTSKGIFIGIQGDLQDITTLAGYISNFRAVKGTALYTSNFTPSTTPLTNVANTSLLTCQSSTVIDNSNNAFAITVNGNAQPTKVNPFGETVTTGVTYSPASHGGSYYFDGTGDRIDAPSSLDNSLGTSNFTLEFWFNPAGFTQPTNQRLVGNVLGASWGSNGWTIGVSSNNIFVQIYNFTTTNVTISTSTNILLPQWYHIALTRNGSTFTLFVNGVSVGTYSSSGSIDGGVARALSVGGNGLSNEHIAGYISGVRLVKGSALYTSAFVPPAAPPSPVAGTTLLLNGTNAAIADGVGKNVLETVGNGRIINGIKKYGTGSMYFDGTDDYLLSYQKPLYNMGSEDFTIECWLYPTAYGGFFAKNQTSDHRWVKVDVQGDGTITLYATNSGSGWQVNSNSASGTWSLNTWWHFALVRSGTSLKVYKNGVSVISATLSGNLYNVDADPFILGATSLSGFAYRQQYTGYIDDLRITKGVARYTSNFTPPTSSFKLK
jgi:hypothetical protein